MDRFKLLELVGLEMDLQVITLSADGETKTVMKGVTHGAVDYLLKHVQIEELRNIWQHAIRRRNVEKDCAKYRNCDSMDGQGLHGQLLPYGGEMLRRIAPSTEMLILWMDKGYMSSLLGILAGIGRIRLRMMRTVVRKVRVVWSIELHHKFVAAVNQIGLDKAVPKRILDHEC